MGYGVSGAEAGTSPNNGEHASKGAPKGALMLRNNRPVLGYCLLD